MPKRASKKRGTTISVDFSGVESGGGRAVPDGTYTLEVSEVTEEESSEGNPYLKVVYKVSDGKMKGARIFDNVSLQPQALWRFKTLLECFEVEVTDSAMDIDLEDLVGKTVDVEIANETWEGKQRPKVAGFLGAGGTARSDDEAGEEEEEAEEEEEEEEEEKKPARKSKGGAKAETKSKYRVGQTVKFKDDKGKTLTGTLTMVSDVDCVVDVKGEEWDLELKDLI